MREFHQPAIGDVHELGYFFGEEEEEIKGLGKKVISN